MAEQDPHQLAADAKEGQTLSTNMADASASDEYQQETHLEGLSSESTNGETENNNGEDIKADVKNSVSAEKEAVLPTKRSPSLDRASMLTGEDNCIQSQAEEGCGDCNKETQRNEQLTKTDEENSGDGSDPGKHNSTTSSPSALQQQIPDKEDIVKQRYDCEPTPPTEPAAPLVTGSPGGESYIVEKKTPQTTAPLTPEDREDNQIDRPRTGQTTGTNCTDSEVREGNGSDLDRQSSTTSPHATLQQQIQDKDVIVGEQDDPPSPTYKETPEPLAPLVTQSPGGDGSDLDRQSSTTSPHATLQQQIQDKDVIVGEQDDPPSPTYKETPEPPAPLVTQSPGESRRYLIPLGIVVVVLAILMQHLLQPESPPQKHDVRQIDIFLRQMDKLKTQFPNQRAEVWSRSRIHMLRHLQTAQPTEPVSLILTAGVRAEMTLRCLAQGLASAFSSALNASVLHIDGTGRASQDSDEVKLDIDSKLQGAFEGDKPVAVIHRFEELPPGSTLIFYRYCDHENAAYKKTCLIFTVLLEEEEEISAKSRLSTVEEMVDDHLQKKFLSGDHPVSFDRMDLDKYGGLWSRISHLILPVTAEEKVEREGCSETSL